MNIINENKEVLEAIKQTKTNKFADGVFPHAIN